jgi:hypothetical protein
MVSAQFDLSLEHQSAQQKFALDAYLPVFSKTALRSDSEKTIKIIEVRKQLKKIRTNLQLDHAKSDHLSLLLSMILSSIIDTEIKLSVSANKGATQWQQFNLSAQLEKIENLDEIASKRLIQSAENLGHFHSKPFNTLSSVQFCRDKAYLSTGEYGFTENQLDERTASVSISGGSNAYSAYYAILITRINHLSIAEHLIQDSKFSLQIQTFFKRCLDKDQLTQLQIGITNSLARTASDIGDELHIMDKQISLPKINTQGGCDYINITPIINPNVFAATNRSLFYIKGQSVQFMSIELGGSNPSNAGTAVGEVAGQNLRLKMAFPRPQVNQARRFLFSFNQRQCCFWSKSLKQQINANLLQCEINLDISKENKRKILRKVVAIALQVLIDQIQSIIIYFESLSKESYQKAFELLDKQYQACFLSKKSDKLCNEILLKTLKSSFRQLKVMKSLELSEQELMWEIETQFKDQINNKGGF